MKLQSRADCGLLAGAAVADAEAPLHLAGGFVHAQGIRAPSGTLCMHIHTVLYPGTAGTTRSR